MNIPPRQYQQPPPPQCHQYDFQPQAQQQHQHHHFSSQFTLHPPEQQNISSTQPLPTHHPLQLLQWNRQDQQHNTWNLEKYNRLHDTRKHPINVDPGPNDRLVVVQFKDEKSKMICVYHNYHELETFCIHPLLFSHDLVNKDTKLLFCVKDQIDGSIRYKFRVKFAAIDDLLSFCSAVAGYVTIKSYDEWNRRNNSSHSDTLNTSSMSMSICSDRSTTPSAKLMDASTQTDTIAMPQQQQSAVEKENNNNNNNNGAQSLIQVQIQNLLSVEAVSEFGRVLSDAMQTCVAAALQANKKPAAKQPTKKIAATQPKKMAAAKANNNNNVNAHVDGEGQGQLGENKENEVIKRRGRSRPATATTPSSSTRNGKRYRGKTPTRWAFYDSVCKEKELLMKDNTYPHRKLTQSPYFLRGCSE